MIKNYFKIAWRNLVRNKVYSAINIAGLATGISACILIFLYVQHELSYDSQFYKSDRIFRISTEMNLMGQSDKYALSSFMLAPTLKQDYPEIDKTVRMITIHKQTFWLGEKAFNEENLFFTDSTFFDIFSYEFIAGNPQTALDEPKSIVLTEQLAEKYFGSAAEAMGKVMQFSKNAHKVTGVFKNPEHSHLKLNGLLSMNTFSKQEQEMMRHDGDWFAMSTYTYVLLKQPGQQHVLEGSLTDLNKRKIEPWIKENKLQAFVKFHVLPLESIHLNSDFTYDISPSGNRLYIYIFGFVALFILLIACINYMNLATARSAKRAKEVGLRKVVGATKSQLVRQFIGESILITLLALVIALALVELLLPVFNQLTGKNFSSLYFVQANFLLNILAILLFVGLVAGSYPAFFLSNFKPVDVLKADKSPRGSSAWLRRFLVVAQFTISIILIIGTIVVFSQMRYLKNSTLGFNKEQVLVIDIPVGDTLLVNRLPKVKQEILQNPQVQKVATSAHIPGEKVGRRLFFTEGANGQREEQSLSVMVVDDDFLDLMEIKLKSGRGFSKEMETDKKNFLLNETAARQLGWHDQAVGKKLSMGEPEFQQVIGVVEDFHFASLHNQIEPLALAFTPKTNGFLLVRLQPQNISSTLAFIKEKWQAFDPKHPMEYFFLDEKFDEQYRAEEKMLTVFGYFAGLTILIACLGLFGLASYTAEQRTKEIGIRKVLGGSVTDIILLLSKDFALLVVVAILVASPVAWYGMSKWLEDFAYRTPLSWWMFALASLASLLIALLTVSFQAAKAASLNPVKALRAE